MFLEACIESNYISSTTSTASFNISHFYQGPNLKEMPCLTLCGQENSKIQQVAEICLNVLANAMKMGAQWSQNEGTSYGTASE